MFGQVKMDSIKKCHITKCWEPAVSVTLSVTVTVSVPLSVYVTFSVSVSLGLNFIIDRFCYCYRNSLKSFNHMIMGVAPSKLILTIKNWQVLNEKTIGDFLDREKYFN